MKAIGHKYRSMRKFIRKLKRKLIEEGELKRYLFYVIGEILLVMVGILLALQVNNWNQNRTERQKEQKILTDLLEEFNLNKERIEEKQALRLAVVPALESYIGTLSKGQADYQSFQYFHSLEFIIGITNPSNGVIDAMISSGELTIISNDALKYLLADWKDQIGNLKENEQILWKATLDYNDYFQQYVIDPRYVWKDWDAERLEKSFDLMQVKIPYRNKLISYETCNKVVIAECESVLTAIEEIMVLLKQEIENAK